MHISSLDKRQTTLVFWGIMDATWVSWYCFQSLQRGNVPYYTHVVSMLSVLPSYGQVVAYVWTLFLWTLEYSIILSAVMLLFGHRMARAICYIQIPFRIYFSTPSISLIPIALRFLGSPGISLAFQLVAVSETIKALTLWRVGNVADDGTSIRK